MSDHKHTVQRCALSVTQVVFLCTKLNLWIVWSGDCTYPITRLTPPFCTALSEPSGLEFAVERKSFCFIKIFTVPLDQWHSCPSFFTGVRKKFDVWSLCRTWKQKCGLCLSSSTTPHLAFRPLFLRPWPQSQCERHYLIATSSDRGTNLGRHGGTKWNTTVSRHFWFSLGSAVLRGCAAS